MSDTFRFDADTALSTRDATRFTGEVRAGWDSPAAAPNGGYVFALALGAADRALPDYRPLSATAHFVRPVNKGAVELDVDVIKTGKLKTTVGVDLTQGGNTGLRILAAYGNEAALSGDAALSMPAPDVGGFDNAVPAPEAATAAAEIAQRFEYRVSGDSRVLSGKRRDTAELHCWMRFSDGRRADLVTLPLIADAFPAALMEITAGVPVVITMEMTVHFRQLPVTDWLQARIRTHNMVDNIIEEDVELWDAKGNLVGMSRQLALVLPGELCRGALPPGETDSRTLGCRSLKWRQPCEPRMETAMSLAKRLSELTGRWFALIVLAAAAIALFTPTVFAPLADYTTWLLAVIMLGMGMTLRPHDFAIIAKRPLPVILGVLAQFTVMPLVGYGLAWAFAMPAALAVGMVLVGAAPGGTASNVMVYLARGDMALSVAMTTVSTLLAPLLTPLLVLTLAGQYLPVSATDLLLSIVQVVVVPVVLGLVLRLVIPRLIERCLDALPLVSVVGITGVVMGVVAASADTILTVGALVLLGVVAHNVLGYGLGYSIAKVCRTDIPVRRAVSIEVGMQNSGLAATLATVHFNPVAALPAAVFSVWHNISGSLLAGYWARKGDRDTVTSS